MNRPLSMMIAACLTAGAPAAGASVLAPPAQGFSESFSGPVFIGSDFRGAGAVLDLPFFDPALGTLNSVTLILKGMADSEIHLSGRGQSPELEPVINGEVQLEVYFDLIDPSLNLGTLASVFGAGGVSCNLPYEATCDVRSPADAVVDQVLDFTGVDAAPFVGTGTFAISTHAAAYISLNEDSGQGGAIYAADYGGTYAGSVAVIYDYLPSAPAGVSEPVSLGIFGAGLAGLIMRQRRARGKS